MLKTDFGILCDFNNVIAEQISDTSVVLITREYPQLRGLYLSVASLQQSHDNPRLLLHTGITLRMSECLDALF